MSIRRALLSVSDKAGLLPFAQFLVAQGVELLSTGGTAKALKDAGLPVRDVSEVTQFPEMMDGRVKTLHPAVHGGLLARRGETSHMEAAAKHGIGMIDLLVVNLYPFEATLAATTDYDTLVENIDIGGPAMIRAAAKNHESVTVIVDVADYEAVMGMMQTHNGAVPPEQRLRFAAKAFARTASYDTLIASWLSDPLHTGGEAADQWPAYLLDAALGQRLRYGENPHQAAAVYQRLDGHGGIAHASVLQGKELSYNNLADAEAAWAIVAEAAEPTVAIIKHANPCGIAIGKDNVEAFARALAGDPQSAFGGILATNRPVTAALVQAVGSLFLEVIVAQEITPEARGLLAAKKNLRVLEVQPESHRSPLVRWQIVPISGGYLVQETDRGVSGELKLVTGEPISEAQQRDAMLAFQWAKFVKSNAIVLVKDGAAIGIGAGQQSRVDSVKIAVDKARRYGHDPKGAALASEAFLPFADNVELAAEAGIATIIQPGGSVRDGEVIAAAEKHGIAMLFTGVRHFKH
jgi:phosphoribosylaminoimidazolecarboxamide formyltransferase/IMP cyclohydrolase